MQNAAAALCADSPGLQSKAGSLGPILNLPLDWNVKGYLSWWSSKGFMVRIGEAAAAAGMTTKTLRFYEDSGLLPVQRSSNGYRDYTEDSVARLEFIRRGRTAGLALTQIREILSLRDAGQAPCAHVQDLLSGQLADLDHQIAELTALRATVAQLHATVSAGTSANCEPDRICSYI